MTTGMQRAERAGAAAELQPIVDAIAAMLRKQNGFIDREVSLTLPVTEGRTLIVSVRSGERRSEARREGSSRGLDARQLRLVNETIHEKLGEPISVSMLSSVAGLSRAHFSHAFRTSVGRPPHAHIVRMRIERAMKLMAETDAPLSEIAVSAGFADQAHFSNRFRRMAGATPAEWRRAHQR
jgi:AraC-like DNA-binding protein